MWSSLLINYPCAKFHHDTTINDGIIYIFHVCFYFWTKDRGPSIMNDIIKFMQIFLNISANTLIVYPVKNFIVICPQAKKPSRISVKT